MDSFDGFVLPTDFYDPDPPDDYYPISLLHVLDCFQKHPNIRVRDGCLEALKKGMKNGDRFGYGDMTAETADQFENLIRGLEIHIPNVSPDTLGLSRSIHLKLKWYPYARETLMDAYLCATRHFSKDYFSRSAKTANALGFLLDLQETSRKLMSDTKAIKHIAYHVADMHPNFQKTLIERLGRSERLEKFLRARLNSFIDHLESREKAFDSDRWEPAKKVLEFMVSYKYGSVQLLELVRRIEELARGRGQETRKTDSLQCLQIACVYDQVMAFCDFVLRASCSDFLSLPN